MQFLIVLAVLLLVVFFVTTPLRRSALRGGNGDPASERAARAEAQAAAAKQAELEELEAAREGKYREIRDAELDHNTGKLSDADFAAVDKTLRSEAIEILKALDKAHGRKTRA
jgi:hypothetical protein